MAGLIKVTDDDDPQKADFWFRIAELYADKQRFYNLPGARARPEDLRRAAEQQRPTLQSQQQGYEKQEQEWLLKAVKAYIAATKFKKYERMDEVLFKLAYMLTSVKKEDQAREFFLRLIKDYPNSKYIPDAYLSFAEFYFNKGEMDSALQLLREGGAVPEVQRLPVRGLQEGLVLRQPGRLQDRARDLRRRRPHDPGRQGQHQRRAEEGAREGSEEGHRQGVLARRRAGQGVGVLPAHRRRLRAEDDGGARRAVLGAGQVRRVEPRLLARSSRRTWTRRASASGRTRSFATRCRRARSAIRSRRSSASARSTTGSPT